jgi:hypothetical protein
MEKEFIPYEQALALKELGFDEKCCACYGSYTHKKSELFLNINNPINIETLLREPTAFNQPSFYVKSPTFSQAFRWFRENFGILVIIDMQKSSGYGLNSAFFHTIKVPTNQIQFKIITNVHDSKEELFEDWISKKAHKTYEEAELACLKKLIEILKQK